MPRTSPVDLFSRAASGDRRSLARAISRIEREPAGLHAGLDRLRPRRRTAPGVPRVIGITGPPGSGKSTLTDRLIRRGRDRGERVAVIAVDPASPFSGGAILGDRLRMEAHALDEGVFIRSLSSRGHLGGLSRATGQIVDLFDAAGFDRVLVETVGVGQSELSVMDVADTVLVVLTPESGDTVQTMKAGLLEVADVFVVNKADRPGAGILCRDLEQMVALDAAAGGAWGRAASRGWRAPVCAVSARDKTGLEAVDAAMQAHAAWLLRDGREMWAERQAGGRLRTFLDLQAERARAQAEARLTEHERLALRSGELSAGTLAARWTER